MTLAQPGWPARAVAAELVDTSPARYAEGMEALGQARDQILSAVKLHCEAKGYCEGRGINNFAPHDCVAAFAMAGLLTSAGFDHYVAVAPEGHIYGFFLERLGTTVLSVFTDYPPTRCEAVEDLTVIRGGRVLVIEDDVASGRTLRLVVEHLQQFAPGSLSLYLGHTRGIQRVENVPDAIEELYLAEDMLDPADRGKHEENFVRSFDTMRG